MVILSLKLVIFAHTSSPLAFVVLDSQTYFSSFVARCCSLEAKSIQKMMAKFRRLTPFILVDGKKQVSTSSKNLRKIVSDRPAAHEVLDVESDSRGSLVSKRHGNDSDVASPCKVVYSYTIFTHCAFISSAFSAGREICIEILQIDLKTILFRKSHESLMTFSQDAKLLLTFFSAESGNSSFLLSQIPRTLEADR